MKRILSLIVLSVALFGAVVPVTAQKTSLVSISGQFYAVMVTQDFGCEYQIYRMSDAHEIASGNGMTCDTLRWGQLWGKDVLTMQDSMGRLAYSFPDGDPTGNTIYAVASYYWEDLFSICPPAEMINSDRFVGLVDGISRYLPHCQYNTGIAGLRSEFEVSELWAMTLPTYDVENFTEVFPVEVDRMLLVDTTGEVVSLVPLPETFILTGFEPLYYRGTSWGPMLVGFVPLIPMADTPEYVVVALLPHGEWVVVDNVPICGDGMCQDPETANTCSDDCGH